MRSSPDFGEFPPSQGVDFLRIPSMPSILGDSTDGASRRRIVYTGFDFAVLMGIIMKHKYFSNENACYSTQIVSVASGKPAVLRY